MPSSVVLICIISQMAAQRGKEVAKLWIRKMGCKGLVARAGSKTVYFASICYYVIYDIEFLTDTSGLLRRDGQRTHANSH